jgi:hypothetical protein
MAARPRSARAGTEGNSCPAGDTMGVRGLCPRTFTREAGVPNLRAKAELSLGVRLFASGRR